MKMYRIFDCCSVRISGLNAVRLLNIVTAMDSVIHDIKTDEEELSILVHVKRKNLKTLEDASKKCGAVYKLEKESGVYYIIKKYLNRKLFCIAVSLNIAILYVLTLFLWNINISGCIKNNPDDIKRIIQDKGIIYGTRISKIDCKKVSNALRDELKDILWASVSIKGTGLFVQIKENTYINDKLAISDEACDLVSEKTGIVMSIITSVGVPMVHKGDEVKAGDVLISGAEYYMNDSKEPYKTKLLHAKGTVIIRSKEEFKWTYPRKVQLRKYYRKTRKKPVFYFFDKRIAGVVPEEKSNTEISINRKVLALGEDFYLPFETDIYRIKTFKIIEKELNDEELKLYASIMYKKFLLGMKSKNIDIIEKNAKMSFNSNEGILNVSLVTQGKTGIEKPVQAEIIEEKQEEDIEEDGNY